MKTTKYILSLVTVCLFALNMNAQNKFTGFDLNVSDEITGSSLGSVRSFGFNLVSTNSSINFGLNVQKENTNVSGLQVTYKYYVTRDEFQNVRLFVFGNLNYERSANLSNDAVNNELKRAAAQYRVERSLNYTTMKLNVLELYTGFGINIQHTKRISTSWQIGVGGYKTLGAYDICNMDRDRSSVSLNLKCGLSYNLFNK